MLDTKKFGVKQVVRQLIRTGVNKSVTGKSDTKQIIRRSAKSTLYRLGRDLVNKFMK